MIKRAGAQAICVLATVLLGCASPPGQDASTGGVRSAPDAHQGKRIRENSRTVPDMSGAAYDTLVEMYNNRDLDAAIRLEAFREIMLSQVRVGRPMSEIVALADSGTWLNGRTVTPRCDFIGVPIFMPSTGGARFRVLPQIGGPFQAAKHAFYIVLSQDVDVPLVITPGYHGDDRGGEEVVVAAIAMPAALETERAKPFPNVHRDQRISDNSRTLPGMNGATYETLLETYKNADLDVEKRLEAFGQVVISQVRAGRLMSDIVAMSGSSAWLNDRTVAWIQGSGSPMFYPGGVGTMFSIQPQIGDRVQRAKYSVSIALSHHVEIDGVTTPEGHNAEKVRVVGIGRSSTWELYG